MYPNERKIRESPESGGVSERDADRSMKNQQKERRGDRNDLRTHREEGGAEVTQSNTTASQKIQFSCEPKAQPLCNEERKDDEANVTYIGMRSSAGEFYCDPAITELLTTTTTTKVPVLYTGSHLFPSAKSHSKS